jgi:CHASE2 domain-containing sensor protein/signal transduction histidine kinase
MGGSMSRSRFLAEAVAIGIALSLMATGLSWSNVTERLDNVVYDWLLRITPRPPARNIVIVGIDERSLAALGPWPWPRRVHAEMLRRLAAYRPRAVIYDILFVSPDAPSGEDDAFESALATMGRVFAPLVLKVPGENGRSYDEVPPIRALSAAAGLGQADVFADADGVVRQVALALDGSKRWFHIAALAARGAPQADSLLARLPPFAPRPATAPLRRQGDTRIAFGGPPGWRFPTVSFIDVLRGQSAAAFRPGDYVLVGATAASFGDQYSTPVLGNASVMPGVELQASILDTLVHGPVVVDAGPGLKFGLPIVAIILLMLGYWRLGPTAAATLWGGLMLSTLALCAGLLAWGHVWLAPVPTVAALALAQPLWTWRRLEAASNYMLEELTRLSRDPGVLSGLEPSPRLGQDRIERQIALMRDTVARMRSLRRLVATAIQSLPDPTVLVGLNGDIVMANLAAKQLFKPADEISHRDVEQFFSTAGEIPPAFDADTLGSPEQDWRVERTGVDGSIRDIQPVAWLDESGAPIGWIVRFADVTAARLAERRREETLQLLTHDMRAPQASILALVAQHASTLSDQFSERLRHYAERTIALADGFLHLARADSGEFAMAPIDLADVLIEAVDDLWPQSSARGVEVATLGADQEVLVSGERSLLTRVMVNLIGNAVKFSDRGQRVECGLRLMRGPGDPGGTPTEVTCWISDSGPGMTREEVAGLFRRFQRRAAGDGRRVDGVGLGLAFVQSVIVQHGGSVACRSEVGKGSTFEVTLPLLSASQPP